MSIFSCNVRILIICIFLSLLLHSLLFFIYFISLNKKGVSPTETILLANFSEIEKKEQEKKIEKNMEKKTSTTDVQPGDIEKSSQEIPLFLLRGSRWTKKPYEPQIDFTNTANESLFFQEINASLIHFQSNKNLITQCLLKNKLDQLQYICDLPKDQQAKKNIEDSLNSKIRAQANSLPYCIQITNTKEKWHAQACH